MPQPDIISDYLDTLSRELSFDVPLARRVRQEVEDHLSEAVAAEPGADAGEAQRRASAISAARAPSPANTPRSRCSGKPGASASSPSSSRPAFWSR
jgi:hypothetical protein